MDTLYREELMDLYKHPAHRGKLQTPTVSAWQKNPLCGDELEMQLIVDSNKISDAKFEGSACSVSLISAELLSDTIIGMSVEEAAKITKDDLLAKLNMNLTTSRVKCAELALDALKDSLKKYDQTN